MTTGLWDLFADGEVEYYPGSSKPLIRTPPPVVKKDADSWDAKPKVYLVAGKEVEFFTVGQLAKALEREPVTIRKWEREGMIPKATFRGQSDDPRGKRRLYTRAQVEGILRIAWEEGLMAHKGKKVEIRKTRFTARVIDLFKELGSK